jgi:hypothetical protein
LGGIDQARGKEKELEMENDATIAGLKPGDLAERVREESLALTPAERAGLIAVLLAEQRRVVEIPKELAAVPEIERVSAANFVANGDPAMTGSRDDPLPEGPPELRDSPEERARLLAILHANPSGVPGISLLDQYRIPPETIELARRHGQAAWAERGIGLTHAYGGPWSPDTQNVVDKEAMKKYQEVFAQRLEEMTRSA